MAKEAECAGPWTIIPQTLKPGDDPRYEKVDGEVCQKLQAISMTTELLWSTVKLRRWLCLNVSFIGLEEGLWLRLQSKR